MFNSRRQTLLNPQRGTLSSTSSGRLPLRSFSVQNLSPIGANRTTSAGGALPSSLQPLTETEQEETRFLQSWERSGVSSLSKTQIESATKRSLSIIVTSEIGHIHREVKQQGQTRYIIDALSVTNFLDNVQRVIRATGMEPAFNSLALFVPPPTTHTEDPEPIVVSRPNADLKPERPCKDLLTARWKMNNRSFVNNKNEIDFKKLNESRPTGDGEDSLGEIPPMHPDEEWVLQMDTYERQMEEYKASIRAHQEYETRKIRYEQENAQVTNRNSLISAHIEILQALANRTITALQLDKHPALKQELDISFEHEGMMIEKPISKENIPAILYLLQQKYMSITASNVTGTLRDVFTTRPVSSISYILGQAELTWNKMHASKILDLMRSPDNDQVIQVSLALSMVPLECKDRGEIMDLGMTLVDQYLQGQRDANIYHHPTSGFKYLLQQIMLRNSALTGGRHHQDPKADQDQKKQSSSVPGAYLAEQGSDTGGGGNTREKAVLVSGLPTFKNEAGKDQVKLKAEVNRQRYNFTQPYTVRGAVTQVPWGCTSSHCTICYKKEGKGFVRTEKVCKDTTPCLANCALCRNYGHYWGTCPFLDVQDNKYRDMYESVVSNVPKQKAAVHQAASAMLASCEDQT